MPEGKWFRIRSRLNGMVLDISGGDCNPGTQIITYPAKDEDYSNQLWRSDPLTRSIRSKLNDEYCMEADGEGTMVVNPYSDGEHQRWKISGDRILKHTDPNMALDIAQKNEDEGATVIQWEFNGQDNQLWDIECEQPEYFFLRSAMHGKVLDVYQACCDEGAKVCCYGAKDTPEDNQLWYEDRHGYLRSKLSNMVLDASSGEIALHSHDSGSDQQRWVLSPGGQIQNVDRPEEVLDIKSRCEDDGACVIPYSAHGGDNQDWIRDIQQV